MGWRGGGKFLLHKLLTHSCVVCVCMFMCVCENIDGWMGEQADGSMGKLVDGCIGEWVNG